MSEWERVRLTDALDFKEGPGILAKDFHDEGVPLIRLAGVKTGAHILDGCNYLDPSKVAKKWSHFALEVGDVLLSTSASLGEVAVVPTDGAGAVPYTGLIRFRPKGDRVSRRFIPIALTSRPFKLQIEAMGVGSVMKHFGPMHLRQMTLDLPPTDVQEAIADVIGALDDKIEANRKLATTADELIQARFAGLGLDDVPHADNETVPLRDLFEINPQRVALRSHEVSYVGMASVPTRGWSVRSDGVRKAASGMRFANGDTVMARITPCLENGKVAYVDSLPEGSVGVGSTEFIVFRSRSDLGIPLELSYPLCRSPRFRDFAIRQMSGTSGRQRVSAKDIADYPLSVISHDELREFGSMVAPLFAAVRSLVDEDWTLKSLRDTLLPKLMSSQLRVEEAMEVAAL